MDETKYTFTQAASEIGVDRRFFGALVNAAKIPHEDLGTLKLIGKAQLQRIRTVLLMLSAEGNHN
jgi:hypothetical protein